MNQHRSSDTATDVALAARLWGVEGAQLDELVDVAQETVDLFDRVRALSYELADDHLTERSEAMVVEEVAGTDASHAWMFRRHPDDVRPAGSTTHQTLRLAVKDCIAVAGVPMTIGTSVIRHVPGRHATVVARALAAGAQFVGTTVCEGLCLSGSSFTSSTGPVPNPFDRTRAAGGSSSGSAVVVANGEADIALGTDLGGSVRNPASWSGVVGLKPTFGILPYTGAMATEASMDHIGLMARTASIIADVLPELAGPDGEDHRQRATAPLRAEPSTTRVRIGVVPEGFQHPLRDARVNAAVLRAAEALARIVGAAVDEVPIPLHMSAPIIHAPIAGEGGLVTIFEQALQGSNHAGPWDPELADDVGRIITARGTELPLNAVAAMVATTVARLRTGGTTTAHAQRLRTRLTHQYQRAFDAADVLVMPTVPMLPHELPVGHLTTREHRRLAFEMHDNNCATNLTGHPALSVPCAMVDGLPVGMLLIGRHGDDLQLLHIAQRLQDEYFSTPAPPRPTS